MFRGSVKTGHSHIKNVWREKQILAPFLTNQLGVNYFNPLQSNLWNRCKLGEKVIAQGDISIIKEFFVFLSYLPVEEQQYCLWCVSLNIKYAQLEFKGISKPPSGQKIRKGKIIY